MNISHASDGIYLHVDTIAVKIHSIKFKAKNIGKETRWMDYGLWY